MPHLLLRTGLSKAWDLAVLLVVAYFLNQLVTGFRTDLSAYNAQVEQVLDATKEDRAQRARDMKEIGRLQRKAEVLLKAADSLRQERAAIPLPPITPAACAPYAARLTLCERETQSLRDAKLSADSAAKVDSARASRAEQRADTLERLLKKRPKPCRLLGVPCPTGGPGLVATPDGLKPGFSVIIPLF